MKKPIKNYRFAAVVFEVTEKGHIEPAMPSVPILEDNGYTVILISISNQGWMVLNQEGTINKEDFSVSIDGEKIVFEFVYVYSSYLKTKGAFQQYLSLLQIPCNHINPFAISVCGNKFFCRNMLLQSNILMPKGIKLGTWDEKMVEKFTFAHPFPLIIKPNIGTDSFLVDKVDNGLELYNAFSAIHSHGNEALIEEFVEGREISCGLLETEKGVQPTPVTEILYGDDFYSNCVKLKRKNTKVTPANISPQLTRECQEISMQIFSFLEVRGYARIDYILKENRFYFLEINISPGLSDRSIFPLQLKAMGISLKDFMKNLISISKSNKFDNDPIKRLRTSYP